MKLRRNYLFLITYEIVMPVQVGISVDTRF